MGKGNCLSGSVWECSPLESMSFLMLGFVFMIIIKDCLPFLSWESALPLDEQGHSTNITWSLPFASCTFRWQGYIVNAFVGVPVLIYYILVREDTHVNENFIIEWWTFLMASKRMFKRTKITLVIGDLVKTSLNGAAGTELWSEEAKEHEERKWSWDFKSFQAFWVRGSREWVFGQLGWGKWCFFFFFRRYQSMIMCDGYDPAEREGVCWRYVEETVTD